MTSKITFTATQDKDLTLFQTQLSKALQPIVSNPILAGVQLNNITLTTGSVNIIPTTLNRNLQGYFIVRMRAQAVVWDTQSLNPSPTQTLYLNTSANVVVDLWVY